MKKQFISLILFSILTCITTTNVTMADTKETVIQEEKKEKTPQQKIKAFSKKILGKKHYRDFMYLPKLTEDSELEGIITINSDLHDNLTNKAINDSECRNAFRLAEKIFTDDTFKDIDKLQYCVWGIAIDKYGNENEQIAIKIFISRDTFSKFNLESEQAEFLYKNLPDVADYYQTDL